MKALGIVCEYNPFHNGHLLQIEKIKSIFPEKPIVAVMSGSFVQRGDVAVAEKFTRARAAVECGVDLVLELPFPYSVLSAELFAKSAVHIMSRVGFIDTLVCGAENDDVELLSKIADVLLSSSLDDELENVLKQDRSLSYPAARQKAVEGLIGANADVLKGSNNILAIEYIKAVKSADNRITPVVLKRDTVRHDSMMPLGSIASATYIRGLIEDGRLEESAGYMPQSSYNALIRDGEVGAFPYDVKKLESSMLAFFRLSNEEDLQKYYLIDFSLANAIVKYAAKSNSLSQLLENLKNKHITLTKLRRVLLGAYLGVTKECAEALPAYTNLLAANGTGCELLKSADESFAIFSKHSLALSHSNEQIAKAARLQCKAESVLAMCAPKQQDGSKLIKTSPKILK